MTGTPIRGAVLGTETQHPRGPARRRRQARAEAVKLLRTRLSRAIGEAELTGAGRRFDCLTEVRPRAEGQGQVRGAPHGVVRAANTSETELESAVGPLGRAQQSRRGVAFSGAEAG